MGQSRPHLFKLQCAPHIIIASSTETEIFPVCLACLCTDADDFSSYSGKTFCMVSILEKDACHLASVFIFYLQESLPNKNLVSSDDEKTLASAQRQATHRKNLSMLQLLWTMQLQMQYTPVKLRPHEYHEYRQYIQQSGNYCGYRQYIQSRVIILVIRGIYNS
jgi:hypothetical protein